MQSQHQKRNNSLQLSDEHTWENIKIKVFIKNEL